MSLIWQIIRKDLVRFRFVLLGWVLFLAGKHLVFAAISGVFGHPSLYWLRLFEIPSPLFFVAIAVPPAIAYFLVAALVFEDPPAGRDPFWVTRPISGAQLLTAKFLFAFLMFVLAPLLAALPWWLACGFGTAEIIPLAGYTGGAYLLVVLLGLALASLTNGYPRFFVWTLAGLAVFLVVHLIPPVFFGIKVGAPPAVSFLMMALGLAGFSLLIACHRFIIRHFGKSLPLVAALTLAFSVWLTMSPPGPLVRLFAPTPAIVPGEENVTVTVAGDLRTFKSGGLSLPLRVDGLPENAVPILWMEATWRSPDGKVRTVKGGTGGNLRALRRAAWHLLRLPDAEKQPPVHQVSFVMAPKHAELIATEAGNVEGKVRMYSSPARLAGEVPVKPGTRRFSGGSFTVSDYARTPGDVSFLVTVRAPRKQEGWRGFGYVALVNRRTGEIIEPAMLDQRTGARPIFTDLAVISIWMRFKLPDPKWVDEASLVVIGLDSGHELNSVVPTYVRPPDRAASLLPKSVPVSADILKQYTGTYLPRPGAKLVIKVFHTGLALQDSGFFRMVILPESRDHFLAPNQDWLFPSREGYQVEFFRDANDAVTHFVVHQDGRDYIVPRLPDKK